MADPLELARSLLASTCPAPPGNRAALDTVVDVILEACSAAYAQAKTSDPGFDEHIERNTGGTDAFEIVVNRAFTEMFGEEVSKTNRGTQGVDGMYENGARIVAVQAKNQKHPMNTKEYAECLEAMLRKLGDEKFATAEKNVVTRSYVSLMTALTRTGPFDTRLLWYTARNCAEGRLVILPFTESAARKLWEKHRDGPAFLRLQETALEQRRALEEEMKRLEEETRQRIQMLEQRAKRIAQWFGDAKGSLELSPPPPADGPQSGLEDESEGTRHTKRLKRDLRFCGDYELTDGIQQRGPSRTVVMLMPAPGSKQVVVARLVDAEKPGWKLALLTAVRAFSMTFRQEAQQA